MVLLTCKVFFVEHLHSSSELSNPRKIKMKLPENQPLKFWRLLLETQNLKPPKRSRSNATTHSEPLAARITKPGDVSKIKGWPFVKFTNKKVQNHGEVAIEYASYSRRVWNFQAKNWSSFLSPLICKVFLILLVDPSYSRPNPGSGRSNVLKFFLQSRCIKNCFKSGIYLFWRSNPWFLQAC